jgi:ABC-2 type transport system ATP-binding protein
MHALDISNLKKTYSNQVEALKGIDLIVERGEFFGLLGPNGAGKSTTIGIIAHLVNKTSGKVSVFGHDIDSEFPAAKCFIGLVPQEYNFNIFETPWQILVDQAGYYGVPYRTACERAKKYLTQMDLWHKAKQASRLLSGGMKRRLMIARALMHEPELLILDEPTAGVDIELRRFMWEYLQEINRQGKTIILTTHYLEEAEYLCKRLAIIDQGMIVQQGKTRELLSQLQIETFVLDLAEPLAAKPELENFTTRLTDEVTLEVDVAKQQDLNQVFAQLSQHNIQVISLRNKTNRLEELFVKLVAKQK